ERDVRGIHELAVRRPGRFGAGGQDTEGGKAQQVAARRARGDIPDGIVMVASRREHAVPPCCRRSADRGWRRCQFCLIVKSSYDADESSLVCPPTVASPLVRLHRG